MSDTPSSTIILGINSAYHQSAAALVKDGQILCAVEEERFSRCKHGKQAEVSNPDELPWEAIRYCLNDIDPKQLSAIAYSFNPTGRLGMLGIDSYSVDLTQGFRTEWGETIFNQHIQRIPVIIAKELGLPGLESRVHFIPHHVSHAASVFYSSPFPHAAVLVLDGIGEMSTGWMGQGNSTGLIPIREIPYPFSIGFLWEKIACFLGFTEYDASKVMGLAAYGDPHRFAPEMDRLFKLLPNQNWNGAPPFWIESSLAGFRRTDMDGLTSLFGPPRHEDEEPETPRFADIAAVLQKRTEEVVLRMACHLHDMTNETNLAYAGGGRFELCR